MSKITLNDVTAGFSSATVINNNNAEIEEAIDNALSRTGGSPNSMEVSLDMNSNRIINLDSPQGPNDAARWVDVTEATEVVGVVVPSQTGNSGRYLGTDGTAASWSNPLTYYERTAAEIAAAITPTAYKFAPGDVRRYGAVANGSTNDSAAIQAAINVQASGGTDVILAPGTSALSTGLTFGGNLKIRGHGNKTSILLVTSGTAISVLRAANTSAFNDGVVLEDFGIILANAADIGVNLTSVSRCDMRSVRIWGDSAQVAVRGTGVLFDAGTASCYANSLNDCDIRNCVRGLHLRAAANANFCYGGQILNCTEGVFQEGTGGSRIDNCAFFGTRIECTAGVCLHLTGHVWGFGFYACRFEAYNAGSRCIEIDGGDATLPPTVLMGCTIGTSGGATDYDLSAMTGRLLVLGQDAAEYTEFTGTGVRHLGLGAFNVGNPASANGGTIGVDSSAANADLTLAPRGTGAVGVTTGVRGNYVTVAGATPTGTGTQVSFGNTVRTTVGAAGAGTALPATPRGYLEIDIGGTKRQIPYYDVP